MLEFFDEKDLEFDFPKKEVEVEKYLGEKKLFPSYILGFRGWRIYNQGNIDYLGLKFFRNPVFQLAYDDSFVPEKTDRLYPVIKEEAWRRGINYSNCLNADQNHDSPAEGCHCGFNAFNDIRKAYEYGDWEMSEQCSYVFGAIAGFGEVQIHRGGWRSEYAEILGLLYGKNKNHLHIDKIADHYDVPVFEDLVNLEEYIMPQGVFADYDDYQ